MAAVQVRRDAHPRSDAQWTNGVSSEIEDTPSAVASPRRVSACPEFEQPTTLDATSKRLASAAEHDDPTSGGTSSTHMPSGRPEWADANDEIVAFAHLRTLAETYYDIQKLRVGIGNRVAHAPVYRDTFDAAQAGAKAAEHQIRKALVKAYRATCRDHCPGVLAWQEETVGIGDVLLARLLGQIGHPTHARPYRQETTDGKRVLVPLEPYERSVSQLRSLCGMGDAARKRRAGMSQADAMALGNPTAKMLCRLMAESCMKLAGTGNKPVSPYRLVYVDAKAHYADRDDWTPAHRDNAALRIVAKAIIRDLWRAAQ